MKKGRPARLSREASRAELISRIGSSVTRIKKLEQVYNEKFRPLNLEFKKIATEWQMKKLPSGEHVLNDHADADYDTKVLDSLALPDPDGERPRRSRHPTIVDIMVNIALLVPSGPEEELCRVRSAGMCWS